MGDALRVGLVGIGNISGQYLETLPRLPGVALVAAADLDPTREVPGVRMMSPEALYAADDVDVVLNLTVPQAHAEVALAAIEAGKHVYGEKPLALSTVEGQSVLAAASAAGVRVGCAPDTVLGTGIQTARRCVDEGVIGTPVAATAFMVTPGHERWHPTPEFYYRPGGGPLFDMGPYYLTALITLLGPVRRVTGLTSTPRAERVIGRGPRAGTAFPVSTPTHVAGTLEHASGALTTLMMSFDVWEANLPRIEVYGTAGSLSVPDPNNFSGEVHVFTPEAAGRPDSAGWTAVAPSAGHRNAGRGIGLADLAESLADGTDHRASGALAYHVLDVMESLLRAAEEGTTQDIASTAERPAPVA
ncbi:Gfo/Idh/MocA family protein [Actinophytocola oryzae]|uniref:Putative dehydrogenase n=1 Tax=Actinophytocola oryzae TaxID=502181 RepID=A0A4R7VAT8_9PSEU|nr:Gfo/Idh/MocA family oxidoreductase [Actinophytocola oryzae]TDV46100.1 putative dehydrogenase [Actinophytocola oryzae]